MVVDTYHRYSNEAEKDIYDDFKMKKNFGVHGLKKIQCCKG